MDDFARVRLNLDDRFATMAVKVNTEQLSDGEEGLISAIQSHSPLDMLILAIKHYKSKKPHWHILCKFGNRKSRRVVRTALKQLGIHFREGIDDNIVQYSIETTGRFNNYAAYLLHQTIAAKREDKAPYDKSEYISNLSEEEVDRILSGYTVSKARLTGFALEHATDKARELGYDFGDIDEYITSLQIAGLTASKESSIRSAYKNGARERMNKREKWTKLVIFIDMNREKSEQLIYAAEKAVGEKRYVISMSGTRDMNITESTEAVVLSYDLGKGEAINKQLFSDSISEIGKPTFMNKAIWAGRYVIVVTNSIIEVPYNHFTVVVQNGKLKVKEKPTHPISDEDANWLKGEYLVFKDRFESAYKEYPKLSRNMNTVFADIE